MNIEVIKDKCWDKHVTVAGLERALGIANGTIGKWKNSNPRINNVQKVANFLGCTVDELLDTPPEEGGQ